MEEATLVISPVSCPAESTAQAPLNQQEKQRLNQILNDVPAEIRSSIYQVYPEFARLILRSLEEGRELNLNRLEQRFKVLLNS
jgi:hypothetical protein